jgi:uncharacterized protein YqhQ
VTDPEREAHGAAEQGWRDRVARDLANPERDDREGDAVAKGILMISLSEQITCVRREIGMRERVYPRFVANGKMKQAAADRELATMRAVLATLEALS